MVHRWQHLQARGSAAGKRGTDQASPGERPLPLTRKNTREALLRAPTYLKWICDGAITVDTKAPDDIGEIIVALEQLAATELEHGRSIEVKDLELAEQASATEIEPTDY